ncbi:MAG: response regulator [Treponema sp.]|jgi:signal transduction histidine kinase/CheY-like chemotaxis protein|nr:response regulator [Treponema sp.]
MVTELIQRTMGCRKLRIAGVLFLCAATYGFPQEQNVIRVGSINRGTIISIADDGTASGYIPALLQELEPYLTDRIVYVRAQTISPELCFPALDDKTADLIVYHTKTSGLQQNYEYSKMCIGHRMTALFTYKTHDYAYRDFQSFRGASVGYIYPFNSMSGEKEYLSSKIEGIRYIPYKNIDDIHRDLRNGALDLAFTGLGNIQDDEIVLDRFSLSETYFITRKGECRKINDALGHFMIEKPEVFAALQKKYFVRNSVTEFTKQEREFIAAAGHRKIPIGVVSDRTVSSLYDDKTGQFTGIEPDIIRSLQQITGLEFTLIPKPAEETAPEFLKKNSLFIGIARSKVLEERFGLQLCTELYPVPVELVVKDSDKFNLKVPHTIALTPDSLFIRDFIKRQYPSWIIVQVKDLQAKLDTVLSGKADCSVFAKYDLQYLLQKPKYKQLHIYPVDFTQFPLTIAAGKSVSPVLISILNKSITILQNTELTSIINRNVVETTYVPTFYDTLYSYRPVYLSLLVIISTIFLILLYVAHLKVRQNQRLAEANTELNRTNAELDAAEKKARRANAVKTDFMARMSHDMRTPMNAIIGFSNFGIEECDDEHFTEYFRKIKESSDYLLALVNDVLDIQRLESETIKLRKTVVPAGEITAHVLTIISPRAAEKNISLTTVFDTVPDGTYLFLDEKRMEQILINILNNAVKYTPSGGQVKWIMEQTIRQDACIVRTTVTDTGVGMSKEFQKHMFEPFSREKNSESKSESSTGLGLSITKKLVEIMGGSIFCRSKLNAGTSFTITISHRIPSSAQIAAYKEIQHGNPSATAACLAGSRLLLCEDNELNREILVKILATQGITVDTAENGSIGVEKAAATQYDGIIMDVRMPVMDGLTAAKKIRQFNKTVPIIALSANAYAEDRKESLEAGMDIHLDKPVDKDALFSALIRLLQQNRTRF